MQLARFEALGLLPPRACAFDLYAEVPVPVGNRLRMRFKKTRRLSLERLLHQLDFAAPVNLVYRTRLRRPYLKFQDATYLKPDKRQLRKFVLANPTVDFEVI